MLPVSPTPSLSLFDWHCWTEASTKFVEDIRRRWKLSCRRLRACAWCWPTNRPCFRLSIRSYVRLSVEHFEGTRKKERKKVWNKKQSPQFCDKSVKTKTVLNDVSLCIYSFLFINLPTELIRFELFYDKTNLKIA